MWWGDRPARFTRYRFSSDKSIINLNIINKKTSEIKVVMHIYEKLTNTVFNPYLPAPNFTVSIFEIVKSNDDFE